MDRGLPERGGGIPNARTEARFGKGASALLSTFLPSSFLPPSFLPCGGGEGVVICVMFWLLLRGVVTRDLS